MADPPRPRRSVGAAPGRRRGSGPRRTARTRAPGPATRPRPRRSPRGAQRAAGPVVAPAPRPRRVDRSEPGARRTPGPRRPEAHARWPGRVATLEVGQQPPHRVAPGADVEAARHERHEVPRAEPDAGRRRRGEVAVEPERLSDLDEVEDATERRGDHQLGLDQVRERRRRLRRLAVGVRGCRRARLRHPVRACAAVLTTRRWWPVGAQVARLRVSGAAPGRSRAPGSTVVARPGTSCSSPGPPRSVRGAAGRRPPTTVRQGPPARGRPSPPAVAGRPGPPAARQTSARTARARRRADRR